MTVGGPAEGGATGGASGPGDGNDCLVLSCIGGCALMGWVGAADALANDESGGVTLGIAGACPEDCDCAAAACC